MGQGQVLHEAADRRRLGAVLLHEFQPGGGIVKQVPHCDGSALRRTGFLNLSRHASLQGENGGVLPVGPRGNLHPADGGNGRQGLAPEAQGADGGQILRMPQFAGGVAEEGGGQFPGGNTAAVVSDPDEAHAAPPQFHHNGGGSGINGVFHQLLHHAGGALYHLACGDQIRHMGGELLNGGHRLTSLFPVSCNGGQGLGFV